VNIGIEERNIDRLHDVKAGSVNKKKIAIVTTHPIQYQAPLFRTLAAHPNLTVEVFFCYMAGPADQANAGFDVEFDWDVPLLEGYPHRFLANRAKSPRVSGFFGLDTPEIADVIAERRYGAVIVAGWHYKSAWQAIRACWRTRTPVMVLSDSHLHTPRTAIKKALKRLLYRRFMPRFDACLASGTWAKEYFIHYGANPERVFFVPHVVDAKRFGAEADRFEDRRELRKQWNLDDDSTVFLFAGKFIEKKRPMDFIRAVASAARRGARVSGLMVGNGPLFSACNALAQKSGAPVRFGGFLNQSQIVGAYRAADALILPSDGRETWGLVVNEAMACGRPCIVSDRVGCGPDLIVPGETGDVYPMGQIGRLAEFVVSYSADRKAVGNMGEAARRRLATMYSINEAVEGIRRALEVIDAG
jgi:glycosyltransferase involved in cell wall biosynthesis